MPVKTTYDFQTGKKTEKWISSDEMIKHLLPSFGEFAMPEDDEVQSQKILQDQLGILYLKKKGILRITETGKHTQQDLDKLTGLNRKRLRDGEWVTINERISNP